MSVTPYLDVIKSGDTAGWYKNNQSSNKDKILEQVAANGAAGLRTLEFQIPRNAKKLRLAVVLTAQNAGSAVVLTPTGAIDGVTFTNWTSMSTAAGVGTLSPFSATDAVTGVDSTTIEVDVTGLKKLKVVVAVTSGDGGDLFDAYASVSLNK